MRELEALVGPLEHGPLPTGLVFHVPQQTDSDDASELGSNSCPNPDAADPFLEELQVQAKELFPVLASQLPRVISRLCAHTQDPSRLVHHQVISNSWANPANRALKCRQYWAHLKQRLAVADVYALYEILISPRSGTPRDGRFWPPR